MRDGVASSEIGSGPRVCWVIHGILGSGRNWRSFARRLADAHPEWRFALPDLRNHGDTGPLAGPHTLSACAADLRAALPEPEVIVGHSFGGKVALELARGGTSARAVWVLDAVPLITRGDRDSDVVRVLEALRGVPMPAADRRDVRAALIASGQPPFLVDWVLTSLRQGPEGWRWVYDLDAVGEMLADYFRTDYGDFLASHQGPPSVRLVRAGRSERWTPEVIGRLRLGSGARVDLLPNAGHWLHVDDPDGLFALLSPAF